MNSNESVFHEVDIEIDQEAEVEVCQLEVCQYLLTVKVRDFLNRFQFYDDEVFDDQVSNESPLKTITMIVDIDGHLGKRLQASTFQFLYKNFLVNTFKQSGAKIAVNLNTCIQNNSTNLILPNQLTHHLYL